MREKRHVGWKFTFTRLSIQTQMTRKVTYLLLFLLYLDVTSTSLYFTGKLSRQWLGGDFGSPHPLFGAIWLGVWVLLGVVWAWDVGLYFVSFLGSVCGPAFAAEALSHKKKFIPPSPICGFYSLAL